MEQGQVLPGRAGTSTCPLPSNRELFGDSLCCFALVGQDCMCVQGAGKPGAPAAVQPAQGSCRGHAEEQRHWLTAHIHLLPAELSGLSPLQVGPAREDLQPGLPHTVTVALTLSQSYVTLSNQGLLQVLTQSTPHAVQFKCKHRAKLTKRALSGEGRHKTASLDHSAPSLGQKLCLPKPKGASFVLHMPPPLLLCERSKGRRAVCQAALSPEQAVHTMSRLLPLLPEQAPLAPSKRPRHD